MNYIFYLWTWLVIGLLGYMTGMISDFILYKRKIKIDIDSVILSLFLGPFIWALLIISIVEYKLWKRRNDGKR